VGELVVIGGGAAGLMAAGRAASAGCRVTLLEKNEKLGRKLAITGKGRCNVTNDASLQDVLKNVPGNGRFLYSALTGFSTRDAMDFFEGLGVPLKVERGHRVFPVSDRAGDIVAALEAYGKRSGVRVLHAAAREIVTRDGAVCAVRTAAGEVPCDAVILATGGVSYRATGSDGWGHREARRLGHTVTPLRGSLVPLEAAGEDCAEMQGLSLRNIRLTVKDGSGKKVYSDFGELLFTHFGLSGPLVLSASAHLRDWEHTAYRAEIDLKPALDEEKLDARLLRDFEAYANRDFQNALGDLLHKKMIPVAVRRSGIPPETKVHSVTREQRRSLLHLLKAFPVELTGPRPVNEAIVTAGGVLVTEVDPRTMASKRVPGLYFAGEILDVDAYTGGFNLQIAWSTAVAAAKGAAEHLTEG